MHAVAYVRVSTEDQVKGTSLDSQTKACIEYARQNNITLAPEHIFREEGVSAKLIDRPKLALLLDHCAKNKGSVNQCIVWKVDRLARKSEYYHVIKARLTSCGVKLASVTEQFTDDPSGVLMEGILAAFAQFDNEVRTARTTGGLRARTLQGGWPHDAPFGYRKARTPSGISTIEPNEHAQIVKNFLEEFVTAAYTIKQAADMAYEMGIRSRSGKRRQWQSIKNILLNPLYAGFVQTKFTDSEMIRGIHEAIIDERTHYKIRAIISGNHKAMSRHAQIDWPLRGGFLLHTCGTPMTGSAPRGRNGPSPRYHCPKCKSKQLGKPVSKAREALHNEFIELLEGIKPNEGAARLFKEIAMREWSRKFKEALSASQKIDAELNTLRERKSRIIDLFIDGKLDEQQKTAKLVETEQLVNDLSLRRITADEEVTEKEKIIDGALLFISNAALFWNQSDLETRKRVQDLLFPEGLTYDCQTGFGTAKLINSYQLIKKIASEEATDPNVVAATGIEPVTSGL